MLITENRIKEVLKEKNIKEYIVNKTDVLTPAAIQVLNDKSIKIIRNQEEKNNSENKIEDKNIEIKPKYQGRYGEYYFEKPEHMTQIFGNILVKKDDERIIFRGKLDSLLSKWLILEKENEKSSDRLKKDLASITNFIRKLVLAEILDQKLEEFEVLGTTLDNIKKISHNPKRFFNRGHLFDISVKNNMLVLKLNEMRTYSREIEIAGIKAFSNGQNIEDNNDILKALNRLSSAIYVMMLKGDKGEY